MSYELNEYVIALVDLLNPFSRWDSSKAAVYISLVSIALSILRFFGAVGG